MEKTKVWGAIPEKSRNVYRIGSKGKKYLIPLDSTVETYYNKNVENLINGATSISGLDS